MTTQASDVPQIEDWSRLLDGKVDMVRLADNMGTSVKMIQQHYGHVTNINFADELTVTSRKPRGLVFKYTEIEKTHRT